MANAKDTKAAPGTPPQEDPQAQKAAAEEQQVHEEAQERRTAGPYSDYDSVEDAQKDLEEKQQKLTEALLEVQVAEQNLPGLKIALEQKKVDEWKQQPVKYDDQGRELGIDGENPVSGPGIYGYGNPAPNTLGLVH